MELYGKGGHVRIFHALTSAVVAVFMAFPRVLRQAFAYDRIAVVLACNIYPAGACVGYRLVCPAVAVFELFRRRPLRQC